MNRRGNLSVEILNNLILKSQQKQDIVRKKLNNIQHSQKPNISQMISFGKRAGRYQPLKQGKEWDTSTQRFNERSMLGKNSGKDDLYQSTCLYDENENLSQEDQTSIKDLPTEVVNDLRNRRSSKDERDVVDSKGESTLIVGSIFDPQTGSIRSSQNQRKQMVARGGATAEEDLSGKYTPNQLGSTPYGVQNNASNSAYSMPGATGSAREDTRDDVTQKTQKRKVAHLIDQRQVKNPAVNSAENIQKASVNVEHEGGTASYGFENSRGAKSDVQLQNILQQPDSGANSDAFYMGNNLTFTSHIPEEHTDDYKSDI